MYRSQEYHRWGSWASDANVWNNNYAELERAARSTFQSIAGLVAALNKCHAYSKENKCLFALFTSGKSII